MSVSRKVTVPSGSGWCVSRLSAGADKARRLCYVRNVPHSPSDVEPLQRVGGELRKIAGLIDKIAGSPSQAEARDHSHELGEISEALGDIAKALQHLAERYSKS